MATIIGDTQPGFLDDVLNGTPGNDLISGLLGNDRLSGGGGADTIIGGRGVDTVLGSEGSDLVFADSDSGAFVFIGDVLADTAPMLAFVRSLGFSVTRSEEDEEVMEARRGV